MDDYNNFADLEPPKDEPEQIWLYSYADMITNLMVFFILIISASSMSGVKYEKIKSALNGTKKAEESIEAVTATLKKKIADNNLQDVVEVKEQDNSILVVFQDHMLFDSGETFIKKENLPLLGEIIKIFKDLPPYARLSIEGYTDDNPISGNQYKSNWHLSALRALSVLDVFSQHQICKENCQISGYGEFHPFKPNRDEKGKPIAENQSQNRRVVIRIF